MVQARFKRLVEKLYLHLAMCVLVSVFVSVSGRLLLCIRDSAGPPYQEDLYTFDFCSCVGSGTQTLTSSSIS